MRVELKKIGEINQKLVSVKSIKNLTGFGLKESKFILDNLINNNNQYIDIINYNETEIQKLRESNIIIDDREDKIDDLLLEFAVNRYQDGVFYKVFEGSYTIDKNLLTIRVEKGKIVYNNDSKDIENVTIKLDFRTSIIEDYAE